MQDLGTVRGSVKKIAVVQKKIDKFLAQLELVKKYLGSRQLEKAKNRPFLSVDYLRAINNYSIIRTNFNVNIALSKYFLLTPGLGVYFIPNTVLLDQNEKNKFGTGGDLALGFEFLTYRGIKTSIDTGVKGSLGVVPNEVDEYFGSAEAFLAYRIYTSDDNKLGLGLTIGGGAFCSITNEECYGTFLSGLQLFLWRAKD